MEGESGLPAEVVERVLSFLPVPDLCRFRAVCKRWNSLICTPRFGSLCLQNANQNSHYVVGRCMRNRDPGRSRRETGWCILDLNARRWYTFKGDLIDASDAVIPLAMDAGLVCEYVENPYSEDLGITVCNPLAKSAKVLPIPPRHPFTYSSDPHVNLVVDSVSNTYKIFLINRLVLEKSPDDPIMLVFESTTNQWRSLANPPELRKDWDDMGDLDPRIGAQVTSVMFRGLLYVLFKSIEHFENWLFSYDAVEDTWTETGIDIQGCDSEEDILVVCGDRLFLVTSWLGNPGSLAILELSVANRDSHVVFQMTKPLVMQVFNLKPEDCPGGQTDIRAFGFDHSIMLASPETGVSIVYDLEKSSFDLLPPTPVKPNFGLRFFCGMPMNQLRLPSGLF